MMVSVTLSCGDAKMVDWNIAMHLRKGDRAVCRVHGDVKITYIDKPRKR